MSQALEQRVREVVAPALPRADLAYTIEADAPLRNVGFDSLGLMGLIANLELEFNIQVAEDDLDNYSFQTIAGILHYVTVKMAG